MAMELLVIVAAYQQDQYDERNRIRLIRRSLRDVSDPFAISDNHFIALFRLPKVVAKYLIDELQPHIKCGHRNHALPLVTKVLAALTFYASGSYQRGVGQDFLLGLSQTSISRCVIAVSKAINNHLAHRYIKFPTTDQERLAIKTRFYEKTGISGMIGAVDCTHIAIISPPTRVEHAYFNRKSFHSKNVQIICDYDLRILNINARYAGATHDAFIWKCSQILAHLRQRYHVEGERSSWLLGDSGYPLQPWLMVPVLNPATRSEERYNVNHRSSRNCIERCNGVLKTRFRCILGERKLHYSPQMAGLITTACAVLHNLMVNARVPEPIISDSDIAVINDRSYMDDEIIPEPRVGLNPELAQGRTIRNNIITRFFN